MNGFPTEYEQDNVNTSSNFKPDAGCWANPRQDPPETRIDAMKMNWRNEVTPFQRKVYEVALKIPKGQVRSYAWVARAIGKPKAARAVGQALKRNRWPNIIPCHRVISSDGGIGGYAWGSAAKRRRLGQEGYRF